MLYDRYSGREVEKILGQDIFAFVHIFNLIKDYIGLLMQDGDSFRFVYANQATINRLKMNKSITGCRLEDVFPKDQVKEYISVFKGVQLTKKSIEFMGNVNIAGQKYFFEATLGPILNELGECQYILGIVRDSTEKKKREKELIETKNILERERKKLNSIIEHNTDAVYQLDLQGNYISTNAKLTEIIGYSEQEIVGYSFIPFIAEEKLVETLHHFENALHGSNEEYETTVRHKNGNNVEVFVKNIPIIIDGVLVGIYGIAKDITEQKKIERLLKNSEQRYKSLFENHSDAIFSCDLDGKFISGNVATENITGYSINELLGKSFLSLVEGDDIKKTLMLSKKAMKEKQPESYEILLRRKDGRYLELFVMNIPIIVENEVVGFYGIAKDITEYNKAHRALLETKEELEIFWEYSVDPVFLIDLEGEVLRVNPAFEKTLEYSEKEVVDLKYSFVPKGKISDQLDIIKRLKNGEKIIAHETQRITKSGKLLDIIASYTPVKDENGNIIGSTVFYKDVTELKKVERQLSNSQKKYKLIMENVSEVIKMMSISGIIEYVSPSNEKILGHSSSEVVGHSFKKFIHPDDRRRMEAAIEQIIAGGSPNPIELRKLHKDGHYIWMEVTTNSIIEEGKVVQLVSTSREITERKRLRDELAKMAFYDYLTDLPNRRSFDEQLKMAIDRANHTKKRVALMMLDGRDFKQINDTYGHDGGDAVIKEMAKRLQSCVRKTDSVARIGGDEMAIILAELDSLELVEEIANRIVQLFKEPLTYNGLEINIGIDIGISIYPDHSINKKQLVKYADQALYEAKEYPPNNYRVYKKTKNEW
ncbi:PAS domain S-box protein [Caldibacillus lycopersici]|uniref:PAS domain S-box protein n=1 Tax=Perspicuibacillus lycopersici TaxID=1325689 RepID=A0AAE3IPT4_9BACI|nr:PAS domain S-box protein [Perspicuibacillus lycopersici]MCU9612353.1 PAS domain S-box protein [Perspicuibacillus lycopersici]